MARVDVVAWYDTREPSVWQSPPMVHETRCSAAEVGLHPRRRCRAYLSWGLGVPTSLSVVPSRLQWPSGCPFLVQTVVLCKYLDGGCFQTLLKTSRVMINPEAEEERYLEGVLMSSRPWNTTKLRTANWQTDEMAHTEST